MTKKVIYERETKYEREMKGFRGEWDLQDAHSYSESHWIKGKVAEWRIAGTPRLTLRITRGRVTWYIRRRDISLRLGLAKEINGETAKYFAEQVQLAAEGKRDLREFISVLIRLETTSKYNDRLLDVDAADQFADPSSVWAYRKRIGDTGITWTWKALTHEYLKYKSPKLKLKYRKQYES